MAKRCVVTGCEASNQDFGTYLFSFPKADEVLRRRWIDAVGKPESWHITDEAAFVCWSHFENKAIQQDVSGFRRTSDAVPTQYLNSDHLLNRISDYFCRFCARSLLSELMGNSISDINRSDDAKKFLALLLPMEDGRRLSNLACDECLMQIKLTIRFIRNCSKATKELERIVELRSSINSEQSKSKGFKVEMNEFEEIPFDSLESEVKVEVSSLMDDISDRDDRFSESDDDNIPLAVQFKQELTEKDLKCSYCSFSCAKRIQLASHMKKHRDILSSKSNQKARLDCGECDFSCNKPVQLKNHRKKHKVRTEQSSTENVSTHKTNEERNENPSNFNADEHDSCASNSDESEDDSPTSKSSSSNLISCSECPYTCTRAIQLASHKKKHTGYQIRRAKWAEKQKVKDSYECEFCDFKCKLRRQMAGHRASHSDLIRKSKPSGKERDHMCSICGKILTTRGSFFVHMKYHNDQRDFSCDICGKKFYSKRDVTMHVESFHEKKVYECEICGVKCTWKNALSKHMRKHDTSSYKLECSFCGKRFMAANELRLHVWRHTGQQLTCDICGAGYRFNFLLTQHKIRAHGIQVEGVKLYKRFRKENKASNTKSSQHKLSQDDITSTEVPSQTTTISEIRGEATRIDQQPSKQPTEDTTSSSYSSEMPAGTYPHPAIHPSHVSAPGDAHQQLPFHTLGPLIEPGVQQTNLFNNY
ncbi:zinc finger protein 652-A-like [Armigeres subalbatus]|uniref:zinc finger protein 652-A-like n=1 Tax=Armigeres subalbatus TaxID=124917 RepID=UPI002ED0B067